MEKFIKIITALSLLVIAINSFRMVAYFEAMVGLLAALVNSN